MRDVDGRQTRPADDVGRPDGRTERAIDVCRAISEAFARKAAEKGLICEQKASPLAPCKRPATCGFFQCQAVLAARERLSRGETPYGEAPPDET